MSKGLTDDQIVTLLSVSSDTFYPSQPQSEESQFHKRFVHNLGRLPGWHLDGCTQGPFSLSYFVYCPHGKNYERLVSLDYLTYSFTDVTMLADLIFREMVNQCLIDHLDTAEKPSYGLTLGDIPSFPSPFSIAFSIAGSPVPGFTETDKIVSDLTKLVPALKDFKTKCPWCTCNNIACMTLPIPSIVMHLNDIHKWTREQIADWLDTLDVDLTIKPVEKLEPLPPPLVNNPLSAIMKGILSQ